MRGILVLLLSWQTLSVLRGEAPAAQERSLEVTRSFDLEPLGRLPAISHHAWSEADRQRAEQFSQLEIVPDGMNQGRCCQLTIAPTFPWGQAPAYRALVIGPDYLPPEADAVRFRVRAIEGRCRFTVGSPTVYFGHSDVMAEPIEVDAGKSTQWQTVELSLHHRLTRNQRRARFGRESPVIYYTRWIQEPLYLYLVRGSQGTAQVDQVELLARGEGRPYPLVPREQLQKVRSIAHFESADDLRQAFTFFQEPIDLARPPYLVRPDWQPARLSRLPEGLVGGHSLLIEQRGTEETCFVGVRASAGSGADAISITLRARNEAGPQPLVIDFLVYAAPASRRTELLTPRHEPPAAWKEQPTLAFDYYLSQPQTKGDSYAFYHARRAVTGGEWTTLTLPLADFICAYGQGDMADAFRQQQPLRGDEIIAIGLTPPFRHRRAVTQIGLDDLAYVKLPADVAGWRSFPQFPR